MTPDYMPVLSAGAHDSPQEGACVMEYVSLLAGEPWSADPACTHPVLAAMARVVNDELPDKDRHVLIPMINRLFGTALSGTESEQCLLSAQLADWCVTQTEHPGAAAFAAEAARATSSGMAAHRAAEACYYATGAVAVPKLPGLMSRLLDEYDRLTGRATSPELSPASLRVLSAAVDT